MCGRRRAGFKPAELNLAPGGGCAILRRRNRLQGDFEDGVS